MLACLLNESNRIELREIPIPRLDRGDALVKMEACGICGTDLEKIDGHLGPGGILGHEVSGTIQQAPDEMKDYVPGDRVVAHHHVPCYNCFSCLRGDMTFDPRTENAPETVKKMTDGGADLALVSTGSENALDQAFASVRKGGKVLLFGAPGIGAQYRLDVSTLFSGQISIISSYSCVESEMHEAIRLVSEKRIDIESPISDRIKLDEANKGLEYAKTSRTAIKTIITS